MTIVLLFDEIAKHINRLNVVGVQANQFKLLIHFELYYVRYLKSPIIRKIYTLFWGLFFMLYLGAQWIELVMAQSLGIYFLRYLRRPFILIAFLPTLRQHHDQWQTISMDYLLPIICFLFEWAIFNQITKQVYRANDSTSIELLKWDKVYKAMNDFGFVAQILMVLVWGFFKITRFGQCKMKEQ